MNEKFGNIAIYKNKNGNDKIEVRIHENTVWLNQKQLSDLFGVSKSTINEHIRNILSVEELNEATIRNFRTVASNGKVYNINYYNLDMRMVVGYRVRSNIGINFRK